MICAHAPGKVVLWGEYAVLAGAPALVMAVDRHARCELRPGGTSWQIETRGFPSDPESCTRARLLDSREPQAQHNWTLLWHVLRQLDGEGLPQGAGVTLDTRGLHSNGHKLGLGSSAALLVAVHGALTRLLGQSPDMGTALAAHRAFQGGSGSGLDVAAAWHGGLIRFQRRGCDVAVRPASLPPGMSVRFVWTGHAARTTNHLSRLQRWLEGPNRGPLDALCEEAQALFSATDPLATLARYVGALQALDDAARLGIFSASHRQLGQLAIAAGVVYKPCGAGGGDLGAAFCRDTLAAERFVELVREHGFTPVSLEAAAHGIQVTG